MAYGRTVLSVTGQPIRVSSDGQPEYKQGGVTIDWGTVVAVNADTTIPNSLDIIYNGNKYLRYGQVITRIQGSADTVTINASGGTFTLNVTNTYGAPTFNNSNNGIITMNPPVVGSYNTSAIAYNASAATLQTALNALPNLGLDAGQNPLVNVTGTQSNNGSSFTLTFAKALGAITLTAAAGSLTGGAGTAVVAATSNGANPGMFGPYDPSATDGRQTLTRGECFVLDELITQYGSQSKLFSPSNDNPGGAFEGGMVWKARILMVLAAQGGSHSLAAGPTESEFNTAFPRIRYTHGNALV